MKNIYNKELDNFTRLTRHYQDWEVELAKPNKDYITTDYFCPRRDVSYDDCLNKLGQLEDIEDKLGIDLITLFKALKQETLFIKTETDIRETLKVGEGWGMKHFEFEDGEPIIFAQIMYPNDISHKDWFTPLRLKLSDYGKSWALTKEELK